MTVSLSLLAVALSLNGLWDFRFDEDLAAPSVKTPEFAAPDKITVPGCFDALPKWFMKRGTGRYRRTFWLETATDNARLIIDGLGLYGRFWLDGREIGVDDLPWSRVELKTGPLTAGVHTLVAAVDNRFDWNYQRLVRPYYDFHFWGGFFHGISLGTDPIRLLVRTRDYRQGLVEIEARDLESTARMEADFAAELRFDGERVVPAQFRQGRAKVCVPNYRLWSPDSPNLHVVEIRFPSGDRPQSASGDRPQLASGDRPWLGRTRFGIRTLEAKNRSIYLNGARIFLKGVNRHDQFLPLGATVPEGVMLTDIQNLKKMGGNFFRGAHYPQSQRFLDLCDECGVMVWEESLGWGNGQMYTVQNGLNELKDAKFVEKQIEQTRLMVQNSFNHPSVIIFAFLNEQNSSLPCAKEVTDKLISSIRAEDSGRLITFACNIINRDICHSNTDIVAFNTYPGTINGYAGSHAAFKDKIHNLPNHGIDWAAAHFRKQYPDKPIMISEIGTGGMAGSNDPSAPMQSEDFQCEHSQLVAEAVYANPEIAGLCYWQYFDTRTCGRECLENSKKPLAMSCAGLFTWDRKPKRSVSVISNWFHHATPAYLKVGRKASADELQRAEADFAQPDRDRLVQDYPVQLDLTHAGGVEFDFQCEDFAAFQQFNAYLKSGQGWYAMTLNLAETTNVQHLVLRKTDVKWREGKVAGWHDISAVRIFGYAGNPVRGSFAAGRFAPFADLSPKAGERRLLWCHSPWGLGYAEADWKASAKMIRAAGFTDVIASIAWANGACYPSQVLPPSPHYAYRKIDAFEACRTACHENGLKFHAWMVCFSLGGHADDKTKAALAAAGRCAVDAKGKVNASWLCPSDPANRAQIVSALRELAAKGADGVQLDYIRYPDGDYCHCARCTEQAKAHPSWNAFRAALISKVVEEAATAIHRDFPQVEISAAVRNTIADSSIRAVGQDWTRWCREGWLDFVCPMDYFPLEDSFRALIERQRSQVAGVRLYPGIGDINLWPEPKRDRERIAGHVRSVRAAGLDGFCVFDFNRRLLGALDVQVP